MKGPAEPPRRLRLLLPAHFVLALSFCGWSAAEGIDSPLLDALLLIVVVGLIPAQASLLALWLVFSPAKWWMRLVGLVGGVMHLELFLVIGTLADFITWVAAIVAGGMMAVFVVIRWRYAEFRRFSRQRVQPEQEGLRFSIRGLILFTFVVAITLLGVRVLRESGPNVFGLAIWGLCFVVVGLASVWAGLGLARPILRIVVVLLIAGVLGFLLGHAQNANALVIYFYTTSTMVLQAGVLITSLLVVRSCGYRFVRKSTTDVEPLDRAGDPPGFCLSPRI